MTRAGLSLAKRRSFALLGLYSGYTTMVDISAIAGTVSALKGAVDIAQAIKGLSDAQAIQTKVIDLNSKILEAQSAAFAANDERLALLEQIRQLERKIASFETWEAEKERYELKDIGRGSLAYALREGMRGTEPPHNLCAACYQNGKKSILQPKSDGFLRLMICHACQARLVVDHIHAQPAHARTDYDPFGGPDGWTGR